MNDDLILFSRQNYKICYIVMSYSKMSESVNDDASDPPKIQSTKIIFISSLVYYFWDA
jgi:hypothetical protein